MKDSLKEANSLSDTLHLWRKLLPPTLAWNDKDPPATDINVARLRAKFYGALYMILRPFLYSAMITLDAQPAPTSSMCSPGTVDPSTTPNSTSKYYNNSTDLSASFERHEFYKFAHQCITGAIQSTIAFDRVGAEPGSPYEGYRPTRTRRLILTNIFGTMHA
jgi:hypothetical protein